MKRAAGLGLAVAALLALLAAGWWLRPAEPASATVVECADLARACRFQHAGRAWTVQADRPPSALRPFRLGVTGTDAPLTARFGMAGMDMGPIALALKPAGPGRQAAEALLPLCVQGRRDWRLWLDGDGGRIEVRFAAAG